MPNVFGPLGSGSSNEPDGGERIWIDAEAAECQLGDQRLMKRLVFTR